MSNIKKKYMVKEEIVWKLNRFIKKHNPVSEESDVVYIMSEIRKILEHEKDHWKNGSFTIVHFYCDWMAHTEKDAITETIKAIMDIMYDDAKKTIESNGRISPDSIAKFAYMKNLQDELRVFLKNYNINTAIVDDGYIPFISNIVKVLESQKINNPNDNIEYFSFDPANDDCAILTVKFNVPINGYPSYHLKMAY